MSGTEPQSSTEPPKGKIGLWLVAAAILLIIALFVVGRYTDILNVEAVQGSIKEFASGPLGLPVLILTFCGCAFIGVPQFLLIGISVYAFGPLWGAIWAWVATLCSGTLTFWLGRLFGKATLARVGQGRIKRFTDFVAKNAFIASAVVRNVPTGPFVMVNMLFGAIRAPYLHYLAGMGAGIMPKIALVAFGLKAIQAALQGNIWMAVLAAIAAIAVFLGGFLYVRHRRGKGENIALSAD